MTKAMRQLKKLAIAVLFFGATTSYAQDWTEDIEFETATITSEYCISLDATKPVAEFYQIDITAFGFSDENEAKKQFYTRANNFLSFQVDLASQTTYLRVHLDRTPEPKDIIWWNDYLESLCAAE